MSSFDYIEVFISHLLNAVCVARTKFTQACDKGFAARAAVNPKSLKYVNVVDATALRWKP